MLNPNVIKYHSEEIQGRKRAPRQKPCEFAEIRPKPLQPMLSYLHAFHAGNKADIVKHATLDVVLRKAQSSMNGVMPAKKSED